MTNGTAGTKRRVLITGAGGGIGTNLAARLKDDYDLRLHYRSAPADGAEDHVAADIADFEQLAPAMEGIDTVLHLAGDPRVPAPWESVLRNNIIGMYNTLETARLAGVRRVVFASTNHVMGMYDRNEEWPVYNALPVRPDSYYGVSKAFGENLGRYYYDEWGLEFIGLRIGWARDTPSDGSEESGGETGRAMWLSPGDCAQVFRCAIEADVPFGIFYAVSDNPDRRWDITDTIIKLDYRPQDSWERSLSNTPIP
ncbi:MAG: NAD(P)-dependent oxidoreductase [Chloroflexota bacterium]|nr:NAD(P)-dependent oxidoreductase [Chloroflexota bacterium]